MVPEVAYQADLDLDVTVDGTEMTLGISGRIGEEVAGGELLAVDGRRAGPGAADRTRSGRALLAVLRQARPSHSRPREPADGLRRLTPDPANHPGRRAHDRGRQGSPSTQIQEVSSSCRSPSPRPAARPSRSPRRSCSCPPPRPRAWRRPSLPAADPAAPIVDPVDGATPAVPDPTITGEQPTAWDHVTVSPDGRTLTVYFYNGAEGCYGLKDVQVDVVGGVPTITVLTGMRQDAISRLCIEIAQLYKTDVVLDAPILGGGVA